MELRICIVFRIQIHKMDEVLNNFYWQNSYIIILNIPIMNALRSNVENWQYIRHTCVDIRRNTCTSKSFVCVYVCANEFDSSLYFNELHSSSVLYCIYVTLYIIIIVIVLLHITIVLSLLLGVATFSRIV